MSTNRVGVNLRASAYLNQGDRKYMEDVSQVAYQKSHDHKDIEYAFFGIFDGHGGKEAANFVKDALMDIIVENKLFWSEDDEDVLKAIGEGFITTHMLMRNEVDKWPKTVSGWPSTSGTTCSVAFIKRQKIFIGHVGDSGIVLGYEDESGIWQGVPLTKDHKPDSKTEKQRIVEMGGKVVSKSGVPRVVWRRPRSGHQGPVRRSTSMDEIPFLAVARSLGDLWSYNPNNDKYVVSPVPDCYCIPIDTKKYRCLIFGTDGLWNVLSPSTAVHMAYNVEKNNEKYYIGVPSTGGARRLWMNPSRSMVTWALECYQKAKVRADNTSAVTVYLDPPGKSKREVLSQARFKSNENNEIDQSSTSDENKADNNGGNEPTGKVQIYEQHTKSGVNDSKGKGMKIDERIAAEPPPWQNAKKYTPKCDLNNSTSDESNKDDTTTKLSASCSKCGNSFSVDKTTPTKEVKMNESLNESPESSSDIQSPVVSSSTASPKPVLKVKSNAIDTVQESQQTTPSKKGIKEKKTLQLEMRGKRKTRSGAFNQDVQENKEQTPVHSDISWKTDEKKESLACSSNQENSDPISRVLKSINRSHSFKSDSKVSCVKRKRISEPLMGNSLPKTPRVETRLHTWTHKPMITRSQGRSHNS